MENNSQARDAENGADVLAAVQLGWLVIESFGRLRMYERASKKPARHEGNKNSEFTFSISGGLTSLDELFWSVNQLHYRFENLGITDPPPPPLPLRGEQELQTELENGKLDLNSLHEELDKWGTRIWVLLNAENGVVGQAYHYGASLANTYWHTTMEWSDDKILEYLNWERLDKTADRFEILADALPAYVGETLANSLHKWSRVNDKDGLKTQLESLKEEQKNKLKTQLKKQLEKQQEVWRDLLFEIRSAESYLKTKSRRIINIYSMAAQITVGVFLIASIYIAGREVGNLFPTDSKENLSNFFAAISSFIVVVGGLLTRFASWISVAGQKAGEWKKRQLILDYTYRDWHSKKE